jgi:hypothetical protein
MANLNLDLIASELIVVGTFGRFTICYQPNLDRWHAIMPAQGQMGAPKLNSALAHYYSDESRDDVMKKASKHLSHFVRFFVIRPPEFLPRSLLGDLRETEGEVFAVTSKVNETEFWFQSEKGNGRHKGTLTDFYEDTEHNRTLIARMSEIAKAALDLNAQYRACKDSLTHAVEPITALDSLLKGTD